MIAWVGWFTPTKRGVLARLAAFLHMPEPPSSVTVLDAIDRVRGLEARLARIEAGRAERLALKRLSTEAGLNQMRDTKG